MVHLFLLFTVLGGHVPGGITDLVVECADLSVWSIPGQIPNLLRQIVEAVEKAVEELKDNLREQLCSRCPASLGILVLVGAWTFGHHGVGRE
jgi:hypothetical protein